MSDLMEKKKRSSSSSSSSANRLDTLPGKEKSPDGSISSPTVPSNGVAFTGPTSPVSDSTLAAAQVGSSPDPAAQVVSSPDPVASPDHVEVAASTMVQDASDPSPAGHEAVKSGELHGSITGPPLKGAWVRNLINSSSHPQQGGIADDVSRWPSLSEARAICTKQGTATRALECQNRARQVTNKANVKAPFAPKLPVEEIYVPEVKEDGNLRFPWAAKMDPSMRNLYRTSTPTYLEDGTPKVTIPSHILLHGPENQKEYIIGQFYRCSTPAGGLVNAVVNRIWGRSCKIFSRKLGETSYLFHIPDSSTRSWVLQRGMWHVDDCLMFVAPWSPAATLSPPEISTIPVWVTLKNIPHQLYSIPGISRIASGLGEPMLTNKPRLDPTLMGEAKIMVEVELDKQFPQRIALDDKKGTITMVDVEYSWIPSKCVRCGHLGHKESRCLQQVPHSQVIIPSSNDGVVSATVSNTKVNFPAYVEVPNLVVATVSTVPTVFAAPVASPALEVEGTAPNTALVTVPNSAIATTDEYVTPQLTENTITVATVMISKEPLIVEPDYTVQTCPASSLILPLSETEDSTSHEATDAVATLSTPVIIKDASENSTEPADAKQITVSSLEGISPLIDSTTPVISHHTTTATEAIPTSPAATISPPVESYMVISTPPHVVTYEVTYEFADEERADYGEVQENTVASLEPMENDLNTEPLEDVDNTSIQRTLRERPVKQTQKAQEMDWTVVGGRGNRGRKGRGGRGKH